MALTTGHEIVAADFDPVVSAGAGSVAANFSLTSVVVKTMFDGAVVYLNLQVVSTNLITATSGNIADTNCFTLNSQYRPTEDTPFSFQDSTAGGTGVIVASSGQVQLRAAFADIAAGSTVRITATYILG